MSIKKFLEFVILCILGSTISLVNAKSYSSSIKMNNNDTLWDLNYSTEFMKVNGYYHPEDDGYRLFDNDCNGNEVLIRTNEITVLNHEVLGAR